MISDTDILAPARGRNWVIAYGITMLAMGAIGLLWPFGSAILIGYAVGWALAFGGAMGLVAGLSAGHFRRHALDAATGLVGLILGLLILLVPLAGTLALLWVMGARFCFAGLLEITIGLSTPHERKRLIALGIVDAIIGAVLLIGFAALDVRLAAIIVSWGFLAAGVVALSSLLGRPSPQKA